MTRPLAVSGPYAAVIPSPLPGGWRLGLRCAGGALTAIDFLPAERPLRPAGDPVAAAAVAALQRYFTDPDAPIDLALAPAGTPFQLRVWNSLRALPPGRPVTYGALARLLGSGPRAVAAGCKANPIPILIPCHRVVAADGLGGYMGASATGQAIKRWLIEHERPG